MCVFLGKQGTISITILHLLKQHMASSFPGRYVLEWEGYNDLHGMFFKSDTQCFVWWAPCKNSTQETLLIPLNRCEIYVGHVAHIHWETTRSIIWQILAAMCQKLEIKLTNIEIPAPNCSPSTEGSKRYRKRLTKYHGIFPRRWGIWTRGRMEKDRSITCQNC